MKRLVPLGSLVVFLFLAGCGGGLPDAEAPTPERVAEPTKPQAGPEEEWGKALVSLDRQHGNRGGYMMYNLRRTLKMEPERSKTGLLTVIQKKLPDWDRAFSLLDVITDQEFPGLKEALLRVYRQDGYSGSKGAAIDLLAKIGVTEIAPEVLAYLKTKRVRFDSSDFQWCRRMLKRGNPPGTKEYIHSLFKEEPLGTGESLGPMAEVLGAVDPEGSFPVLDRLLKEDAWDARGYLGAIRGLGASGTEKAKSALLAFVEMIQDLIDSKLMVLARKYGTSQIAAYGELARFQGEDVWENLLLYEVPWIAGMEEDQERYKAAVSRIPPDFIKKTATRWANQPWRNDSKYKPKNSEQRKLTKGDALLGKKLDAKFRSYQLEQIKRFRGNSMFDGNIAAHLTALMNYARSGDQEVRDLYREWAGKTGQTRFSSRNIARQMLAEFKDPLLLEYLVKDDSYGNQSDWIRVRDWEPQVLPGLSDLFVKKEIKNGLGSSGISDVVFQYLGAESRKDVLQKIESEIKKCLPNPRHTHLSSWISGLKSWKDTDADRVLKEVIQSYEKEGIKTSGYEGDNVKREKQGNLNLAQSILSARGDRDSFKIVYARKPLLYNAEWTGVPDEFKPFLKQDYGPMTLRWPSLEEVLKGR